MGALKNIMFKEENGFFKVPADFAGSFDLVPMHNGKLYLVFCNRQRMRRYLRQYDFKPIGSCTKILDSKRDK